MKKPRFLFVVLALLALVMVSRACTKFLDDPYTKSCDLGVGDEVEVWNQIEYLLPECWNLVATEPNLVLQFGLAYTLELSLTPFPGEDALTLELDDVGTVYALASDFTAEDVQRILDSLKRHPFSIASSSCDAPNSTFAESINYEWRGLRLSLPFCWGAEETLSNAESFERDVLTLTKGDDSFWVEITMASTPVDGEPLSPIRSDHDTYSTFDYNGYFYVETNAPDEHEVQIILNSIELVTKSP